MKQRIRGYAHAHQNIPFLPDAQIFRLWAAGYKHHVLLEIRCSYLQLGGGSYWDILLLSRFKVLFIIPEGASSNHITIRQKIKKKNMKNDIE